MAKTPSSSQRRPSFRQFSIEAYTGCKSPDTYTFAKNGNGATVIAKRTPGDAVTDLPERVLARLSDELLPLDPLHDLLLPRELLDRLRLLP